LRQAQSIALQAQINPHFLHNTLDTISWSAMRLTGGRNDTSSMINSLAGLLRYALHDASTLVTLSEELENTRVYLELQAIRYKDLFEVVWDIETGTETLSVIKLILQPIVENAIVHGVKPLGQNGIITVCAKAGDGCLRLTVRDNGIGMDKRSADMLQKKLSDQEAIYVERHIGITNVNQRIRLFFGDKYGVHVFLNEKTGSGTKKAGNDANAAENRGCEIQIALPAIKKI
jgi:two-component system sensor histidine kinase YesM